jgi:hypothetical protein
VRRAPLAVVRCILVALLAGCAASDGARRAPGDGPPWIRAPFKVRAGDDASWSRIDLDDAGWQSVDSTLLPGTAIAGFTGLAWFRGWIDVPAEMAGRPAPVYGRFVGAADVFVDGRPALAFGDPDAVAATGSTPVDFTSDAPHWVTFPEPGRHLVAVRFARLPP